MSGNMHPFPFTEEEWSAVSEATTRVVNATLSDDSVLRASAIVEVCAILDELRQRHGEHPVLLETEADFNDDSARQRILYQQSIDLAARNGLPTYLARMSLASLLLDEFEQPEAARRELQSCATEIAEHADDWDRKQWVELLEQCDKSRSERSDQIKQ